MWYVTVYINLSGEFNFGSYPSNVFPALREAQIDLHLFSRK